MHYRFKVSHPAKIKLGINWLKSHEAIGIYELEENRDIIIGGFSPKLPQEPKYLKLLSCDDERVNWDTQWESSSIEIEFKNHFFKLKAGPGFGDSSHPTTKLCMEAISVLKPKAVLDIGSGSGILSITALALGIESVIGVEIDPEAISHHEGNIELNHFKPMTISKELKEEYLKFDDQLILINMILSEQKQVFESMPKIFEKQKKWYGSGILIDGLEEAIHFYNSKGLKILKIDELDKWAGIYMEKS